MIEYGQVGSAARHHEALQTVSVVCLVYQESTLGQHAPCHAHHPSPVWCVDLADPPEASAMHSPNDQYVLPPSDQLSDPTSAGGLGLWPMKRCPDNQEARDAFLLHLRYNFRNPPLKARDYTAIEHQVGQLALTAGPGRSKAQVKFITDLDLPHIRAYTPG